MKIIFICGSLEPGKDGVGDYTRRLGSELMRQGVRVGMLAYHDKHITHKIEGFQESEGFDIPVLRLPRPWTDKERCHDAKEWIDLHNPDWLSLQFVPYAFNDKGIPTKIGNNLKLIAGNRNWHLMVHELWIGMSHESALKERCIGAVQKIIIKRVFSKLAPKVIHTQTDLYKHQLQKMGFSASVLPLFSNITYCQEDINTNFQEEFNLPNNYFVVFGSIHKNAPIEAFVEELRGLDKNKTLSFVALGRNGAELEHWKQIIEKSGFHLLVLGEQSIENISFVLSHAKFGIATTPYYVVGKSGSVAAMHRHKLPVICMSKAWNPIGFNSKNALKGVVDYIKGNLKECLQQDLIINTDDILIANVAKSSLNTLKI